MRPIVLENAFLLFERWAHLAHAYISTLRNIQRTENPHKRRQLKPQCVTRLVNGQRIFNAQFTLVIIGKYIDYWHTSGISHNSFLWLFCFLCGFQRKLTCWCRQWSNSRWTTLHTKHARLMATPNDFGFQFWKATNVQQFIFFRFRGQSTMNRL